MNVYDIAIGGEVMEYTIQKLGKLAGISTRTLRYYDEIKLLIPARINSSGYRIYGQHEVNRLQQILFYRELGLGLEEIKAIIDASTFDEQLALENHHTQLLEKQEQLNNLIQNVEKTIATLKGETTMTNKEKFEGFKKKMVDDNEKKYGKEIREKYGNDTINKSNQKVMDMTEEEMNAINKLGDEVISTLLLAMDSGDPAGELGLKTAELHKKWLMNYWSEYSNEAHAGLSLMYVADERFTVYYDTHREGAAEFLCDAIHCFTGVERQY